MASSYYKPCPELDRCDELIEKYWDTEQYDKCFAGHLELAEKGYPLAECQVGYFYYRGLGVEKDLAKALYWTQRAAEHGEAETLADRRHEADTERDEEKRDLACGGWRRRSRSSLPSGVEAEGLLEKLL